MNRRKIILYFPVPKNLGLTMELTSLLKIEDLFSRNYSVPDAVLRSHNIINIVQIYLVYIYVYVQIKNT